MQPVAYGIFTYAGLLPYNRCTCSVEGGKTVIINWYPGHMAKARRLIEGNLKIIDVAIELVDARIPMSSTNPMIGQLLGQKPSIVVMNKADLADAEILKLWTAYYKEQGRMVMALNSKDGKGIKQLVQAVRKLAEPKLVKWRAKGLKSRSVRTIILGIPNVGKSTLINMLMQKPIAKSSDKPGKTQLINYFLVNENWYFVDLPGYGYAKASLESRRKWIDETYEYFIDRKPLILVLIDGNIPPQKIDLEFLQALSEESLDFVIVVTKADKANQKTLHQNIRLLKQSVQKQIWFLPEMVVSSSVKKMGRDQILSIIEERVNKY